MTIAAVAIGVAMAILGHLIHLLKKVVEARASGQRIGLIEFVKARPYRTALGYLLDSGDVTAMTALGVGYMADSGLAMLGKRGGRA